MLAGRNADLLARRRPQPEPGRFRVLDTPDDYFAPRPLVKPTARPNLPVIAPAPAPTPAPTVAPPPPGVTGTDTTRAMGGFGSLGPIQSPFGRRPKPGEFGQEVDFLPLGGEY